MVVKKMPETEKKDKQDRMIEILEETLKWTRVTSIPQVKRLFLDILPSDKEKIAYHFSDGAHSGKDVAAVAGVATGTVSNWWKVWVKSGIAESVSVKGGERARRMFSLEDFGIQVPESKPTAHEEKPKAPEEAAKQQLPEAKDSGAPTADSKAEESV